MLGVCLFVYFSFFFPFFLSRKMAFFCLGLCFAFRIQYVFGVAFRLNILLKFIFAMYYLSGTYVSTQSSLSLWDESAWTLDLPDVCRMCRRTV